MEPSVNDADDSVLSELEEDPFPTVKETELLSTKKSRKRSASKSGVLGRLSQDTNSSSKGDESVESYAEPSLEMSSQLSLFADSQLSGTEVEGNEDEILNDIPDSPTKEIELFSGKDAQTNLEVPLIHETKPLKKRAIVNASNGTEKKVSLIRNKTVIVPPSPAPVVESVHKKISMTSETDPKIESASKKVTSIKRMTSPERLALRAQRFSLGSGDKVLKLTGNKTLTTTSAKLDAKSISSNKLAPDIDKLKKRAERFGVNVSKVMKQVEEKERVLKRQMRFGQLASVKASGDETQQKKLRSQRFSKLS